MAALFAVVYFAVIAVSTPEGTVLINVESPEVTVSFSNDEITFENSGKKYKLKTTEKKTLKIVVDDVEIESGTPEISVSKNETKIITAKLLPDRRLELDIDGKTSTFAAPAKMNVASPSAPRESGNRFALQFDGDQDVVILPMDGVPEVCTIEAWITPEYRTDSYQYPVRADFRYPRSIFLNVEKRGPLKAMFGGGDGNTWKSHDWKNPKPRLENRLLHIAGVWSKGLPACM